MQNFFDNLLKIVFALMAAIVALSLVSMFFGYFIFIAIVALLVVAVGLLVRARARDRERMRDLRRDLDRARRWP